MNWFNDPQFWLGAVNLLGLALIGIFNWLSHQKIVGNDLHHLSADVASIAKKQDKQDEILIEMGKDLSYIKGKEENNDKIIKILEKSLQK